MVIVEIIFDVGTFAFELTTELISKVFALLKSPLTSSRGSITHACEYFYESVPSTSVG